MNDLSNQQSFFEKRRLLMRWAVWFFFINVILFWLVGIRYFISCSPWQMGTMTLMGKVLLVLFTIVAYVGHLAFLAFIPCVLVSIPLILFFPQRHLVFTASVLVATAALILFVADVFVYGVYHFHLNGIILGILFSKNGLQRFEPSWFERLLSMLYIFSILLTECYLAVCVWKHVIRKKFFIGYGKWVLIAIGFCLYLSYNMVVFSGKTEMFHRFTETARFLPYYNNILGKLSLNNMDLIGIEKFDFGELSQSKQVSFPLNYPINSLRFGPNKKRYNLIFIVVDSLRFDTVNEKIMPNIARFAKGSWDFRKHYSGGDASRPGLFSLFYAIPATYWTATKEQHQGPIFIHELLKQHYKMGIFSSYGLDYPIMRPTIFQEIKNAKITIPNYSPYKKDQYITSEFQEFVNKADIKKTKFFSFLLYGTTHGVCKEEKTLGPFKPVITRCNRLGLTKHNDPVPHFNRYKNALHLIDKQIGIVLDDVTKKGLLKNTVIIITGDHGQEFNDNHLGYWGHSSNFTRYQVQTPLIIHWPGKTPEVFYHKTSHFDVVPTLLRRIFDCKNPYSDYSVGKDLLSSDERPDLVVGSYIDFGILEPDRITTIYPTGNYQIGDLHGRPITGAKLNAKRMKHVFDELEAFYKR